jgi:hypothetical protein
VRNPLTRGRWTAFGPGLSPVCIAGRRSEKFAPAAVSRPRQQAGVMGGVAHCSNDVSGPKQRRVSV